MATNAANIFSGILNKNRNKLNNANVYQTFWNMVMSVHTFAENIKGTFAELYEMAKVDGSQYGDKKLFIETNALPTYDWLNWDEAQNLLELFPPEDPVVMELTLDQFRQIRLSLDAVLTKQSFTDEGSFQQFNSVMLGWIQDTERTYMSTLYNVFIGTTTADGGRQNDSITIGADDNRALKIAEKLANILISLKNVSREYNDYGLYRSYDESDLVVVWNSEVYNAIKRYDMPQIFHKDGLLDEFEERVLPPNFFGKDVGESGTSTTPEGNEKKTGTGTIRAKYEKVYEVASAEADERARKSKKDGKFYVHVYAGEQLPGNITFNQSDAYYEDEKIAFKVIHKQSAPVMSGFRMQTNFFNARSLTTTYFLTFAYSTLKRLGSKPFITVSIEEGQ